MKKLIIIMTIIGIILSNNITYALTVNDPDIIHELNEGEVYVNGEIRTDLRDIQYVGNGYLVRLNDGEQRYFTENFEQFKEVEIFEDHDSYDPYSRAGYMDEIKWANGVYMARSNVYDNQINTGRVYEKNGYLYILDTDFKLLKKIEFDYYVRSMTYINGTYFVEISNKSFLRATSRGNAGDEIVEEIYSSEDLENWTIETNLQRIEAVDGNNILAMNSYDLFTFNSGQIGNQILYEDFDIDMTNYYTATDIPSQKIINTVGEYFYIVDYTAKYGEPVYLWISKDGIYFTKIYLGSVNLNNNIDSLYYTYSTGNETFNKYIKKSDIDKYLQTCDVYVRLNDKILGFSQPPVMEDDRTLVPMRFLFEQMGAEVTWDEANQAATATINTSALGAGASATGRATLSNSDISFPNLAKTEKSVTFSVDNTTATVNGAIATMDVPARLINDQTFVPLRFLSENLGYTVDWDEATNTAIITTE